MIKKKKNKLPEGVVRYKKVSGGIHNHRDGQIVRKGEILICRPDELSAIIKEGFVCLDEEAKKAFDGGIDIGLKHRGNGWYDVINTVTGDKLNTEALRAKDAKEFLSGSPEDVEEQMKGITKGPSEEEELEKEIDAEVEEEDEETDKEEE